MPYPNLLPGPVQPECRITLRHDADGVGVELLLTDDHGRTYHEAKLIPYNVPVSMLFAGLAGVWERFSNISISAARLHFLATMKMIDYECTPM